MEDFILALKLLAQECRFGDFKELAIRDRYIMGVYDKDLQKKLLTEDNLTMASAEKIMYTWEMAANRSKLLNESGHSGQVASIRGSVKTRLGSRPSGRGQYEQRGSYNNRDRSRSSSRSRNRSDGRVFSFRPGAWRRREQNQNTDLVCDYCGKHGHVRKRCFKLKNLKRDAVNMVEESKPGPSSDKMLSELLNRMRARHDDSDDSDSDSDRPWRHKGDSTPKPDKAG
ncbi:uncharacterized protein LOC131684227 [Topomyia yanbarensis]|uniref:uncharacterized protein LOC131684227 n=1 Tax=Topomyia yanbarensis TaxID=2498891 RepID=UPI00273A9A19|nr:uncharacterized protein LOC131684227 [Topomyia yanbarensis]